MRGTGRERSTRALEEKVRDSFPSLPFFPPSLLPILQHLWIISHMCYALVLNGFSAIRGGFSLETGDGLDDPCEASLGWPQSCWEGDNSAASTGQLSIRTQGVGKGKTGISKYL